MLDFFRVEERVEWRKIEEIGISRRLPLVASNGPVPFGNALITPG